MAAADHQLGCGSSYYCPPGLRKLRLQQYHMSDEALQRLPRSLTRNPFSKAEWRKQYAAAKIDLRSTAKQVSVYALLSDQDCLDNKLCYNWSMGYDQDLLPRWTCTAQPSR